MSQIKNIIQWGAGALLGLAIAAVSFRAGYAFGGGDAEAMQELREYGEYQSEQIAKATAIFQQEHGLRVFVQAQLEELSAKLADCEWRRRETGVHEDAVRDLRVELAELEHMAGEGTILRRLRMLLASRQRIDGNCSPEGVWTFAVFSSDGSWYEVQGETLEELIGGAQ